MLDQIFTLKQIGEKAREKKRRVCVGFIGMEKADDRINRKFCGMCILSEIKSMYVDTLACVRVKGVRVGGLG